MHISLANKITFVRIIGVAVFVLLLLYLRTAVQTGAAHTETLRLAGLALFVVLILTDALDGYIARRRNEETELGSVLDPFADKALFIVSFVILSSTVFRDTLTAIPMWLVWLVISRDTILCFGALLVHFFAGTVAIRASWMGKTATFFQACVICLVLANHDGPLYWSAIGAAGAATLLSGIYYCIQGYRQLRMQT